MVLLTPTVLILELKVKVFLWHALASYIQVLSRLFLERDSDTLGCMWSLGKHYVWNIVLGSVFYTHGTQSRENMINSGFYTNAVSFVSVRQTLAP